jgi:hypothetical protein
MAQDGLKLISYATCVIDMQEVIQVQQQMTQGIDME